MATRDPSTRSDFYVYALFRETGVPFYIGKGKGQRWTQHERDARNGARGYKATLIRSMQKRGIKIIKVKIHEGLTEVAAYGYEIALIKAIGWGGNGILLNRTDGGDGSPGLRGHKRSPETRAKMTASATGRKMSPESIAKSAAANRGRKHSADHRAKSAAGLRGRAKSPEAIAKSAAARRGGKRTAETRAKMAAAKLGKKQTAEHIAKRLATQRAARERRAEAQAFLPTAFMAHTPDTPAHVPPPCET
jgi:hypothetical protein